MLTKSILLKSHLILFGMLLPVLLLSSCQSSNNQEETVSLAEAKKTVADFEKSKTLKPPRRTDDVLSLFDNWPDKKTEERAAWLIEANAPIPENISNFLKVTTLYARAKAARRLGRNGQELAYLREAVRLTAAGSVNGDVNLTPIFERFLYRDAAWAEFNDGKAETAVQFFRQSIQRTSGGSSWEEDYGGWMSLTGIAYVQYYFGDLNSAQNTSKRALSAIKDAGKAIPPTPQGYQGASTHLGALKHNPWREIYANTVVYTRLQAEGRWREAETNIRTALKAFQRGFGGRGSLLYAHGREDDWIDLQLSTLAGNLIQQGRSSEAELVLRAGLRDALESQGKFSKSTALLLSGFHSVLIGQSRHKEAEALSRRVLRIYGVLQVPAGSRLSGEARFRLGEALALQGRWSEARKFYESTLNAFSAGEYSFRRFFANDPTMLLTLLTAKGVDAAVPLLAGSLRQALANKGDDHYDTLELTALNALLAQKKGDHRAALERYRQVVPRLIAADRQARISGNQRFDRRWRLVKILENYLVVLQQAVLKAADRDDADQFIAEAFRIAAFAQSHEVDWALAKSAARNTANNPELASLIRGEQDAKLQLEAINARLSAALSQPSERQNRAAILALRSRAKKLRLSGVTLRKAIKDDFPEYTELIAPPPPTVSDVQNTLAKGEALLSFYVTGQKTYVWAIPASGRVGFTAANIGRGELGKMIKQLRRALDSNPATLEDIPNFPVTLAHQVYKLLYQPVADAWQDSKSLIVVVNDVLATLPPSLLVSKAHKLAKSEKLLFESYRQVPWLGRQHAITALPSVTSILTLRKNQPARLSQRPFIGFGDPFFTKARSRRQLASATRGTLIRQRSIVLRSRPNTRSAASAKLKTLPHLPETADELRSVAKSLGANPARDVFLGARASEEQVKAAKLDKYRVVAFATHGLLAGDLDGLLQPALALSSPEVTGGTEDGLLTMGEILGLKMRADWVVLSACNTGAGDGAGAKALSGLGRSFFYAGTRALLVSNWPVHSEATTFLMSDLFRRQGKAGGDRAEALRRTRMAMVDKAAYRDAAGRPVFSYAHPIFWAPFTLVGDSGRAVAQ